MMEGKPWAYLEQLFEAAGVKPLEPSEAGSSGVIKPAKRSKQTSADKVGMVYWELSRFLAATAPEGSLFFEAVDVCAARGVSDMVAKEIACLFFAMNPKLNPLCGGSLGTDGEAVPIGELCDDVAAYLQDTEPKDAQINIKARLLFYLSKCIIDKEPDEKAEAGKPAGSGHIKRRKARLPGINFPVDKVNSRVWSFATEQKEPLHVALKAEKKGAKKPLDIYYAVDFSELDKDPQTAVIARTLTEFDKRVYCACGAIRESGAEYTTLPEIHSAMGSNAKNYNTRDKERLLESITKMAKTWISLNNEQEAAAYNYPEYVYKGNLLYIEMVQEVVNGKVTDAVVHFLRDLPLLDFAKKRRQIDPIPIKVLQSPVSKTDANMAIEGYLLERILRAKRGGEPRRILFNTIAEHANQTEPKQRTRLPEKVLRYLEHYASCGWIAGFEKDADGVTVSFLRDKVEA